jgi:hypothetical protein
VSAGFSKAPLNQTNAPWERNTVMLFELKVTDQFD